MSSNVVSPDQFSLLRLKREAKRLGKSNGAPHHENLDTVARQWGFASFFTASRALGTKTPEPFVIPFADLVAAAVPFPGVRASYSAVPDREGVCIWALENDLKRFIYAAGELGVVEDHDAFSTMFSFNQDLRVGLKGRYRRLAKDTKNATIVDDAGQRLYQLGARFDWPTFLLYVKSFRNYGKLAPQDLVWEPYADFLENARDQLLKKQFETHIPKIMEWLDQIDLRNPDLIHWVRDMDEIWVDELDDDARAEGLQLAMEFFATGNADLMLDIAESAMF